MFAIFQVATHAMDSTLLKYSAKDHFFKAALCHFCIDMLNAKVGRVSVLIQKQSLTQHLRVVNPPFPTACCAEVWRNVSSIFRFSRMQAAKGCSLKI